MKNIMIIPAVVMVAAACTTALAVGPGKNIEFSDGAAGSVIFDGSTHQAAGLACKDCHTADLFPTMKKGTVKITMDELYAGKYCGKCHDGKSAFSSKSCDRCHYKAGV